MENNESDKDKHFVKHGISDSADPQDKQLFEELSQIILQALTSGGHNYQPPPLIYRASSMGVCSRKILLEKDLGKFLSEEEIADLPQWYLEELEQEEVIDFSASVAGQVIHEVIQDILTERVHSIEEEVRMEVGQAKLVGHYDLLLDDGKEERVVIDIKSTVSKREYLPKEKHLRQLLAYQGMLGGIKGALLYVNRNTWQLSYHSQPFDKNSFSTKIVTKLANLATAENTGELPVAMPEFAEECISIFHKCPFYEYCFGSEESADTL